MGFHAVVAVFPIVAVMVFLVVLRWSALKAMPVAYAITVLIALGFWQIPLIRVLAASLRGAVIALATLTYPGGNVITYAYNSVGRMLSAIDAGNSINYATEAKWAPQGALCSMKNGASIVSTLTFNNRLQPDRIHVTTAGAPATPCDTPTQTANILDFTYGFNLGVTNNGNVASVANNRNPDRTQTFTYDELNRVETGQSQATSGAYDWGLSYSYDVWANLLEAQVTKGDDVPMLSVTVNSKNQITNAGFSYDAAGNLTNDGSATYTYDAENRMTSTAGVNYTYDGDGRRVKKDNGKLYWRGFGSKVFLETDSMGNNPKEYVFFAGKRIARRDSSGAVHYFFEDHLGSSRVMTDATGTVVEDSDFYPFGGERIVVNNLDNDYKFTGKERDPESGLDYFGARYYASSLARFSSVDPIFISSRRFANPQQLNLYTYVGNNPVKFIDPTGKERKNVTVGRRTVTVDHRIEKQTRKFLRNLPKGAVVTTSFRTTREQAGLHQEMLAGKRKGPVAPPTRSLHEAGLGLDVGVPLKLDKKKQTKLRAAIAKAAVDAGFTPLGKSDPVHFSIAPETVGTTFQQAYRENQATYVEAPAPEPIPTVEVPIEADTLTSSEDTEEEEEEEKEKEVT